MIIVERIVAGQSFCIGRKAEGQGMEFFPFFMDIEGQKGLIVGGGEVALRKVSKLLPFHPRLTVVAPVIIKELMDIQEIICLQRPFDRNDICDQMFVIAASDEKEVNRETARLCREKNIPINVVDDREACSFLFPALVKRGKLAIGISTQGASPALAGWIRGSVEAALPDGIEESLVYLEELRSEVKEDVSQQEKRAEILRQAAWDCAGQGRSGQEEKGRVILAGAGCGSYDLITVRGFRAVQSAQVLVYDDLIDDRLLCCAGEGCERIYVGKRKGVHSMTQEEINELLISRAKEGKRVVRLKGGDPFVFGRGGEEILALRAAGIPVEEIPGISSGIAVPAQAGIPVTHRGLSGSVHLITGHGAASKDGLPEEMETLAKLSGTLVFLMGFTNLEKIADRLMTYGKPSDMPTAVIQGGFEGEMQIVRGCLEDIAEKVCQSGLTAPAVIVVGDTAEMDLFA